MLFLAKRRRRHQSDPGTRRPWAARSVTSIHAAEVADQLPSAEDPSLDACGSGPKCDHTHRPSSAAPSLDSKNRPTPEKVQEAELLNEFDEYGTELHRDARVWKVYVKETDKYDAELVKEWVDSTDVILIFAALFSAISAGFLTESSKMLQEDPTVAMKQTLFAISQALLSMANGTQPPGLALPSSTYPTDFVPSRTAVYVNTLWYLSLSLSLATSFVAILAKDWCHSFMGGRTGHPYLQTCRRQQKWDMIERWKMSELLTVLPSLIHVALLLFAIGLCIRLWDQHLVVALPVICVSAIALAFYVFLSLAAILLDFFPYPTIVSRFCRAEVVRRSAHAINYFASRFLVLHPYQLVLFLGYLITWAIKCLVCAFIIVPGLVRHFGPLLDRWRTSITSSSLHLQLLSWPFYVSARLLLWYPADSAFASLSTLFWWFDSLGHWMRKKFSISGSGLNRTRTQFESKPSSQAGDYLLRQSEVKGLALSWLIKNCEVPQSVDIALQSIAGASKEFVRKPLKDCNATVEILRRLASSTLYRANDATMSVSLYTRALAFLSSPATQSSNNLQNGTEGNLEVTIWDMQNQIENNVAALITDGQFHPSPHNLAALRIGNTAASHSLQLLKDNTGNANELFDSIIQLLESHTRDEGLLHPSALLPLVNAAALLSLFSNYPPASSSLPKLCMQLAQRKTYARMPKLNIALTTCALIQNTHAIHERSMQHGGSAYVANAVRILSEFQSANEQVLRAISPIGLRELWSSPESYGLDHTEYNTQHPTNNQFLSVASLLTESSDAAVQLAQALHGVYSLCHVGRPSPETYVFVIRTICQQPASRVLCWQLLSKFHFPIFSFNFAHCLRHDLDGNLITQAAETGDETMQFFARGQQWLYFTCYLGLSPSDTGHHVLEGYLKDHFPDYVRGEAKHRELGDLIKHAWNNGAQNITESLGVHAYRLMECVFQSQNSLTPQTIQDGLLNIPKALRGLSSFTGWRPKPNEATEATNPTEKPIGPGSQKETGNASIASHEHLVLEPVGKEESNNVEDESKSIHDSGHAQTPQIQIASNKSLPISDEITAEVVAGNEPRGEEANGVYQKDETNGDLRVRTEVEDVAPGETSEVGNEGPELASNHSTGSDEGGVPAVPTQEQVYPGNGREVDHEIHAAGAGLSTVTEGHVVIDMSVDSPR